MSLLTYHETITKNTNQRRLSELSNALSLASKNLIWKKFFNTDFPHAQACIKAMPKHTQSTTSVIAYYLALHPNLDKQNRHWKNIAAAYELARSSETWRNFFTQEFTTIQNCLNAMPEHTQTTATIISYYLSLHQDISLATHREWECQAKAHDLSLSAASWEKFFQTEYKHPKLCLADMPKHQQSSVTIMAYYLSFHPEYIAQRIWSSAASATALAQSDSAWQAFFETTYADPKTCLSHAPTHKQTPATIINYYLSLHPEFKQARKWAEYACAATLSHKSQSWTAFLNSTFETPLDCIKNMPLSQHSTATVMNYYLAYNHSLITSQSHWRECACALICFKKHPEIFDALKNSEATLEDIKLAYGPKLPTLKVLKAYWHIIEQYNCTNTYIQRYTRLTTLN